MKKRFLFITTLLLSLLLVGCNINSNNSSNGNNSVVIQQTIRTIKLVQVKKLELLSIPKEGHSI